MSTLVVPIGSTLGVVSPSTKTLTRLFAALGLRVTLDLEPLEHGNVSVEQLRQDWRGLSAAQRVEEAMELSEFLTGVSASAAEARRDD